MINADLIKLCRKRTRAELSRDSFKEEDEATICTVLSKKRRISVSTTAAAGVATQKKSVSFASTGVSAVIPVKAASSSKTWHTRSDYAAFKGNMKRDVVYFAQSLRCCRQQATQKKPCCGDYDKAEYCALGLEKYCSSITEQMRAKQMKQHRVATILQQQAVQKQLCLMGVGQTEEAHRALRMLASTMAQPAVDRAIVRAARLQASQIKIF